MTHWRFRPSTLRAIGVWLRFVLLLMAALIGFIVASYLLSGALTWD